jgi:intracellular sulfur oxidation DsrE/DsrF family protein
MKQALVILLLLACGVSRSQTQDPLRIVWDMSARDTAEHSAIFRQVNNVLTSDPAARIEVVFHGNAIWVLTKDSSVHAQRIQKDLQRGVIFAACNNSMRRLKVDASQLLPGITVVPVAMIELARKQQEGWSYLKAGH